MNIVGAVISSAIFAVVFGGLSYFLMRRRGGVDAMGSALRQTGIAVVMFFLITLFAQQMGYA